MSAHVDTSLPGLFPAVERIGLIMDACCNLLCHLGVLEIAACAEVCAHNVLLKLILKVVEVIRGTTALAVVGLRVLLFRVLFLTIGFNIVVV